MQTKAIKQKIKAVGNVKKITKTMELVSASKMKKAIGDALRVRPFAKEAARVFKDVALDPDFTHPLLTPRDSGKKLLVLIGSNKGLCGSYHVQLARFLQATYGSRKSGEGQPVDVVCVGKYAEKIALRFGYTPIALFADKVFGNTHAQIITKMVIDAFTHEAYQSVDVVYTHYASATTFMPVSHIVLPYHTDDGQPDTRGETRYTYEPGIHEVISQLVPLTVEHILFSSVKEALASEHSARMFAMKNASDNAGELVKELKLTFNRARQAQVTQEISEIVAGASAHQ